MDVYFSDQSEFISKVHYEANYPKALRTGVITDFDTFPPRNNNFEISGGEWIEYFGTGWFILGKGSFLQVKTEISKNPQANYALQFQGRGWYSPYFTLDLAVNGKPVARISNDSNQGQPYQITDYIQDDSNLITLTLIDGEFYLSQFEITELF